MGKNLQKHDETAALHTRATPASLGDQHVEIISRLVSTSHLPKKI
jgi:hypothetical protein